MPDWISTPAPWKILHILYAVSHVLEVQLGKNIRSSLVVAYQLLLSIQHDHTVRHIVQDYIRRHTGKIIVAYPPDNNADQHHGDTAHKRRRVKRQHHPSQIGQKRSDRQLRPPSSLRYSDVSTVIVS